MNKLRVDEIIGVFFLFFKIFELEVEDQQVRKMIISFLRNKKKVRALRLQNSGRQMILKTE